MKSKLKPSLLAAVSASMAIGSLAYGQDDCNASTLHGLYIFSATGFNIVQGVAQPKAVTELIRFNGDGTLSSPAATASINGVIVRSTAVGTYTVEPDCIGKLQFGPPGPSFDMFIGAHEIHMIQTGGAVPGVLEGQVKRVSD